MYDYDSRIPYPINLPNEDGQFLNKESSMTILMVPKNEDNPYLVQVPDPQYQSADLYILEMPQQQFDEDEEDSQNDNNTSTANSTEATNVTESIHPNVTVKPQAVIYIPDQWTAKNFTIML